MWNFGTYSLQKTSVATCTFWCSIFLMIDLKKHTSHMSNVYKQDKVTLDDQTEQEFHSIYLCTINLTNQTAHHSTVQPSKIMNPYVLRKTLKCICTLQIKKCKAETYFIWKVMHESISEWWKTSCRPLASLRYFVKVESPLWYCSL